MTPKQPWSEEELRVLLLLYTQWNLSKQRKLVHQVFTTIFPDWKGTQHALHREFSGRFGDGTSPLWYDIDRPNKERQEPYTTEELATNMALFERITSSVDEATRKELDQFLSRSWPHYLDGDCWRQATADRFRREREEREKRGDGAGSHAGSSKSQAGEKEAGKAEEERPKAKGKEKSDEENRETEPITKAPEKTGKGKKKAPFGSMGSAEWQQRHIEQRDREQARKEKQAKLQEMKSGRNLRSRRDKVEEFEATIAKDDVEEDEDMDDDDGELFEKPAKPSNPSRTYGTRSKADNKPFGKLKTPSKKPIEISSGDEEEEEDEIDEIPAKVTATQHSNARQASKPTPSLRKARARTAAGSEDEEDAKVIEDDEDAEAGQKPTRPRAPARPSRNQSLLSAHLAAVDSGKIRKPVAPEKPDDEEEEQGEDEIMQDPAKPSASTRVSSRQKVPSTPAVTSPRRTRARAASATNESNDEKENDVEQTPANPSAIKRASRFRKTKSTHVASTRQTRGTAQRAWATDDKAESDEEEIPLSEEDEELPDVQEESEDER
ncbi:hypothetical protein CB0940_07228 [Cercospora beticola]|uniref:Uncharacterized protein n=1 Tax=Cercospora beticola TaxID=122368 RepID=A0A2G5H928_CERBT|nr:hypothetical protein CB0940_07228 [Cercospora beticola]PIA89037.1 hypothetical protein CB0940_07228 [Cercospora beticola]WPB03160.1 hypothetical protein RHO25_007797 [Cercospora beticola]